MTTDRYKIDYLNKCRVRQGGHEWVSADSDGMNGYFLIPFTDHKSLQHRLACVASNADGWEHVSVTDQSTRRTQEICPTWEMMCRVKRAFWDDHECVIEYHVPMSEWIDDHPGCLHLWKPIGADIPRPPALMVGFGI